IVMPAMNVICGEGGAAGRFDARGSVSCTFSTPHHASSAHGGQRMSSPSSTASSDPVPAHHKISYVEFASAHPQQSCDFFAALFGWRRESFGP
ncbi:MAG TPA: hypothetical protein DEP10_11310, partial [Alphaproteobacteria bacterium]|nr:hypothetical protein [Alphaproteobacteria bacterium]